MTDKVLLHLDVNGQRYDVAAAPHHTLLEVLREECGLTGTKHGCELGECGACTVLLDGAPILSCLTLPLEIEGHAITTVEGLAGGPEPHPLQRAFAEEGAAQCGYCTPGILLSAAALLERNPHPTREEMAEAISGNLCRCTGYTAIYEAIEKASRISGGAGAESLREVGVSSRMGAKLSGGAGAEPLREVGASSRMGAKLSGGAGAEPLREVGASSRMGAKLP